ncbi:MAG: Sensory box histidine kinase/response regulator [uncultured Sulfurovum sp.]|uniref:histidine kinase n=1 Tax=uncultured Sulfurovum sp. TaxID=269237 RepID=A0A6S6S780_9BACT|nr:MAG: Sensory box histidine kinase/response regulator [uncultured Sulfurovum sp.]
MDDERIKRIVNRERNARKESERLLEEKSSELYEINQNLEKLVTERTEKLTTALKNANIAMKTKDDFVSNMSHEIRTPLNAIMGFVEIMKSTEYEEIAFANYLNIIHDSSESLLKIINDILDFSKLQSGQFKISHIEVNLKEKLEHGYSLFANLAKEKDIDFFITFSKDFPKALLVDDIRIMQIVSNFVSNALKFTPKRGTVSIKASYAHATGELIVKIVDTGIGIKESAQGKIFNSFEQEDRTVTREYGGTGLGLSISKQLIELMSGKIVFKSIHGKGSVFGFQIPLKIVEETKKVVKVEKTGIENFEGKILVAEDNEVNILLISLLLEQFSVPFDVVENGLLAIEAVKNETYNLVLMDNQMPKLSGKDATIEIRKFDKDIPIVALSASALKTEKEEFLDVGMNDVLTKPINQVELLDILEKYPNC